MHESAPARQPERKYAQSEASEKISEASGVPREGIEDVEGTGGETPVYQKNKTNVLQAQGMVRGYCAMAKDEKDAEDGRKALAYNGAVPMIVYGPGEKDIREVRIILAAKGYFTLNMRDIADMGVLPPGGKKYHPGDWGSNDGKSKKKTEHWLTVWIHTSKAAFRNHNIIMGPLEAWNQIKDCADTVKFLGGERAISRGSIAVPWHFHWAEHRCADPCSNAGVR